MIERIQIYAWDGVEILRGIPDAVRWPFERIAWAAERVIVWPIQERTGGWSGPLRVAAVTGLAVAAIAAAALGLRLASDGGNSTTPEVSATVPTPPVAVEPVEATPAPAEPVLQGAAPDFKPEADAGTSKAIATAAGATPAAAKTGASTKPTTATNAEPAGPAALAVAKQFANAFVLFETGENDAEVRAAFAETATPQLARSLLQRPPRLPASAEVPRAKVLNIVPGPRQGETHTLSVSLLRLGVTSELRVTVQRDKASGEWQVVDMLG